MLALIASIQMQATKTVDSHIYAMKLGYFRLLFMVQSCSYTLGLSCPKRKRLKVYENVNYIAVTSRASKIQIFKFRPGRDMNPGLPRKSLNIGILTHVGGWIPSQAEL